MKEEEKIEDILKDLLSTHMECPICGRYFEKSRNNICCSDICARKNSKKNRFKNLGI